MLRGDQALLVKEVDDQARQRASGAHPAARANPAHAPGSEGRKQGGSAGVRRYLRTQHQASEDLRFTSTTHTGREATMVHKHCTHRVGGHRH